MNRKIVLLLIIASVLFTGCAKQAMQDQGTADIKNEPPQPGVTVLPEEPEPVTEKCGIEICHGLDISCGPNVPELCTEQYQLGDFCRQFAICEIINGTCQMVPNNKFKQCRSCVEKCEDLGGEPAFECEAECREELK
jgi:hypothetical protein